MKKLIAFMLCMVPLLMSAMEKEEKLYFRFRPKIQHKDNQAVTKFLQKNTNFNVAKPCGPWMSIMSIAVQEEFYNEEIFKKLLGTISNINNTENDGFSPLMTAVAAENNEAVKVLIKKGADVNIRSKRQGIHIFDSRGMTPLMKSSTLVNNTIMETLLAAKANPNLQDAKGRTALMHMIKGYKTDQWAKTQLLLQAGAKINLKDISGKTVLDQEMNPELRILLKEKILERKKACKQTFLCFSDLANSSEHYVYLLPKALYAEVEKHYEDMNI